VYIHICVHTHIHTYIYVYIHTYTHTYTHPQILHIFSCNTKSYTHIAVPAGPKDGVSTMLLLQVSKKVSYKMRLTWEHAFRTTRFWIWLTPRRRERGSVNGVEMLLLWDAEGCGFETCNAHSPTKLPHHRGTSCPHHKRHEKIGIWPGLSESSGPKYSASQGTNFCGVVLNGRL